MAVIATGAEAEITALEWRGRSAVNKHRLAKTYRHPDLDARLRDERARDEATLLLRCRKAGVPVPVVYDIDRAGANLVLERVEGKSLRAQLSLDVDATASSRMHELGTIIGRMHDAGIAHGDLTTSNILVPESADSSSLVLIDFGLGQFAQEDEPRGVDLHLVEEALEATEARATELMAAFLAGYSSAECAPNVVRRLEAIRQRGRYRDAT